MYTKFLIVAACIVAWIKPGNCLNCFQCESNKESDCKEFLEHDNMEQLTVKSKDCKVDSAQYCIKTTGVWGGVVGTTRFCSSRDMGNQCQYLTYSDHDRAYRACVYTCQGDGCNSGRTYTISTGLVLSTVVLLLYRLL